MNLSHNIKVPYKCRCNPLQDSSHTTLSKQLREIPNQKIEGNLKRKISFLSKEIDGDTSENCSMIIFVVMYLTFHILNYTHSCSAVLHTFCHMLFSNSIQYNKNESFALGLRPTRLASLVIDLIRRPENETREWGSFNVIKSSNTCDGLGHVCLHFDITNRKLGRSTYYLTLQTS